MKKRIVTMGVLVLVMLALVMAGCDILFDKEKQFENDISATTLTFNEWANGQLTADDEEWFKFTATVEKQYIHFDRGTLTDLYVQLCDSTGEEVGNQMNIDGDNDEIVPLTVTVGNSYYLKVWPYGSGSGTYKIGFNETTASPATWAMMDSAPVLASGIWWKNGQLNAGEEDWYKFTATAGTQYFHIERGSLTDLYVQLRDDKGNVVGSETNIDSDSEENFSWMVISGNVYHLRIRPYSSSGNGTYSVVFNTSATRPAL